MYKIICAGLCWLSCSLLWADSIGYVTALDSGSAEVTQNTQVIPEFASGIDADAMNQCMQRVRNQCPQTLGWEQKDACIKNALAAADLKCQQASLLYQKLGLLPNKFQSLGAVSVFTVFYPADGQEIFHMIDSAGALIDLADERNVTIANDPEFKKIQKKNPTAGLMPLLADKVSESPQVLAPKALANQKGDDVLQLIFKQYVHASPCNACQRVAIAHIVYRFSYPQGKFLGVRWLKTDPLTQNDQTQLMSKQS